MGRVTTDLADAVRHAALPDVAARQVFGRLCRETLGVESRTLMTALGLPTGDDIGNVDAAVVDAQAKQWGERWGRRFPMAMLAEPPV